jgi:SAM-dependent methyltransferase
MKYARRYFEWQLRLMEPELGQRVIEIGCGIGNFTRLIANRERVIAIDVDDGCVQAFEQALIGHPNVRAYRMDVLSREFLGLSAEAPDSIVCLNVLEHVEDDRQAMENMRAVLPESGRVVLILPAFESLYGPIDANLGHYRRYSRQGIRKLAEESGFSVRKLRYMNFAGFFGWWFNARVMKREKQSARQIALFDAAVVPLQSRLEAMIPIPVGQSLFVVLEKKPKPGADRIAQGGRVTGSTSARAPDNSSPGTIPCSKQAFCGSYSTSQQAN